MENREDSLEAFEEIKGRLGRLLPEERAALKELLNQA
jgi:hypothetical protein